MIPADFQDCFVNSSTEEQGQIIDQLLSLATSASTLHDTGDLEKPSVVLIVTAKIWLPIDV